MPATRGAPTERVKSGSVESDAAADDRFGIWVGLDDDVIVVGPVSDDCAAGVDCGAAYVYRFNGISWIE